MEKTESQKDKQHIISDGFRYRKDRANKDGSSAWRCFNHDCKGRMKATSAEETTLTTEHNHAPDPEGIIAKKTAAEIRRRAPTTVEKPRQILQQCSQGISLQVANLLPAYSASRKTIRRRRRNDLLRGDISSVSDIIIPECLRMSTRDSNFLLWDSESDDPGRFLMFGTSENLGLLGYTITGLLTVPLKCLPLYALSFLPFLR